MKSILIVGALKTLAFASVFVGGAFELKYEYSVVAGFAGALVIINYAKHIEAHQPLGRQEQ
jgi:hypothetical protein